MEYVIGSVSRDYPEAVQEKVNTAMEILIYHQLENTDPAVLEGMLSESALTKFLGDGEIVWDPEEFIDLLGLAEAQTHLNVLKGHGFIDSIEDENGKEIVWVTDTGKKLVDAIKKNGIDDTIC